MYKVHVPDKTYCASGEKHTSTGDVLETECPYNIERWLYTLEVSTGHSYELLRVPSSNLYIYLSKPLVHLIDEYQVRFLFIMRLLS